MEESNHFSSIVLTRESIPDEKPGESLASSTKNNDVFRAFEKWGPPLKDGSAVSYDEQTGLAVLQVNSLAAFIQAMGYLKFKLKDECNVFYRGQTKLFFEEKDDSGMFYFRPTALRKVQKPSAMRNAISKLQKQVEIVRQANRMFQNKIKYPDRVIEALLQQYGYGTTWFDAVDNIWVALWFACHRSDYTVKIDTDGGSRSFIHMVRRIPRDEDDSERFAYIILLKGKNGGDSELVDLRCEIPSQFIRPHVQHGLLVRKTSRSNPNMFSLIKGIIRIRLEKALEWLGTGRILLPETMMPPPNYDSGFKQLLESEHKMGEDKILFPIYC